MKGFYDWLGVSNEYVSIDPIDKNYMFVAIPAIPKTEAVIPINGISSEDASALNVFMENSDDQQSPNLGNPC